MSVGSSVWSNNRIFNGKSHDINGCVLQTYLDISLQIYQPSDRERICISEDKNSYLLGGNRVMEVRADSVTGQDWLRVTVQLPPVFTLFFFFSMVVVS